MYLNYQELEKALVGARANIHVLEVCTDAEVAYNRWKEIEKIAHKQAHQIKYSASSFSSESVKEVLSQ